MAVEVAIGVVAWRLVDALDEWSEHFGHILTNYWLFIVPKQVVLAIIAVIIIDILATVDLLVSLHSIHILIEIGVLGNIDDVVVILVVHLSGTHHLKVLAHATHLASCHGWLLHMDHVACGHGGMGQLVLLSSLALLKVSLIVDMHFVEHLAVLAYLNIAHMLLLLLNLVTLVELVLLLLVSLEVAIAVTVEI